MGFNDKVAVALSSAVYCEAEGTEVDIPNGWRKYDTRKNEDTGLVVYLYIEEEGGSTGGSSIFAFMGTGVTAGSETAKGQMKSNAELQDDPDHDIDIVRKAVQFVKEATSQLEKQKGGDWKHHTTGHSLGGAVATCVAVALPDKIAKCVTFESPGTFKYWRERASSSRDDKFWRGLITEYVSFPNPINTCLPHIGSVYRLHMLMHARSSPGHIIRCVVGSGLRLIVWVSLANTVAAAAGHAHGFWAAKVGSVTVKLAKLLAARKFTPKKIKQAFKDGLREDQASKDSRAAIEKGGDVKVDDPAAKPMLSILKMLPEKARPGFIVGFWALVTAAASNTGYVSMRTLAQINDTMAEHSIDAIAKHFGDDGKPNMVTPMESWPYLKIMVEHRLPVEHFRRCIVEGMTPFHPTAYGLHNVSDRQSVLLKRASTMPGFQEQSRGSCEQ